MAACVHHNLTLLPEPGKKLQCRHCHLTISADELGGGHCPECFETSGERRYDFDEAPSARTRSAQYRCEDCGALIGDR